MIYFFTALPRYVRQALRGVTNILSYLKVIPSTGDLCQEYANPDESEGHEDPPVVCSRSFWIYSKTGMSNSFKVCRPCAMWSAASLSSPSSQCLFNKRAFGCYARRFCGICRSLNARMLLLPTGGVLYVLPKVAEWVRRGDVIAEITDVYGRPLHKHFAPETGVVVGKSCNPVCQTGDRILHLVRRTATARLHLLVRLRGFFTHAEDCLFGETEKLGQRLMPHARKRCVFKTATARWHLLIRYCVLITHAEVCFFWGDRDTQTRLVADLANVACFPQGIVTDTFPESQNDGHV